MIEHLQGQQVHLQDFFWTGVEDAPPWMYNDKFLTHYQPNMVVHHHTSTVYISNKDVGTKIPDDLPKPLECPSCPTELTTPTFFNEVDQDIGVLVGEDPGPR